MLPANWLTEVVKIAASVVLLVTFYFVFWPRIKVILRKGDADLRRIELTAEYKNSDIDLEDGEVYRGLVLRHVKSATRDDQLICLFVNDGDSAHNLQIEAEGNITAKIEPCDHLKAGDTGSLKVDRPTSKNDILIMLRYEDERGYVHRERYCLDADGHLLCREDDLVS